MKFASPVSLFDEVKVALKDRFSDFFRSNPDVEIRILRVPEGKWGKWSVNLFFQMARFYRRSPEELAREAGAYLLERALVEDFRVEKGYLNFYFSKKAILESFRRVLASDEFSEIISFVKNSIKDSAGSRLSLKELPSFFKPDLENSGPSKPPKILLEFVSANPTGPLHVGHGRCASVGDSLARILRFLGLDVDTEYYVNDSGLQIEILGRSVLARMKEISPESVPGEWHFPEDGYRGDYIIEIARRALKEIELSGLGENEILKRISEFAISIILDDIKSDLEEFGVEFDSWFFEHVLKEPFSCGDSDCLSKAIELLRSENLIYEKEGALWFASSKFGDDKDRVLVRSDGTPTYFGLDAAYHLHKIERGYDVLFNIWGFDHHGYVKRLSAVVEALSVAYRGGEAGPVDLRVLLYQMVRLKRGGEPVAMSTRAGKFVTLRQLREEVGNDAARFIYLTKTIDTPLDFDLEIAAKKSMDNPVYYVQYAHARSGSILRKKGVSEFELLSPHHLSSVLDSLKEDCLELEDASLLSSLFEFVEVLPSIYRTGDPYLLVSFLLSFARDFHNF